MYQDTECAVCEHKHEKQSGKCDCECTEVGEWTASCPKCGHSEKEKDPECACVCGR